jgi:hypothetical protein
VINAGVAELDLGSGFLQASNQRQAVDSILLALTTFPSIQQVRVSVDGTPLAAFWGRLRRRISPAALKPGVIGRYAGREPEFRKCFSGLWLCFLRRFSPRLRIFAWSA